ncbi:hypothetical protein SAMN05421796_101210 [Chryseobacterium piscicola]|uniref:Uncharacterized protein n=1 Tax=Chryseobacterium piscicola TaxID=551459 RepID=A0A1N7JYA5_9FLAO|nr:hypothetical protein [Chryseobacterium piscicola]PQA96598.1 hypothetical protein B0A70_05670 [Chryseobacterium piscicola]SIS54332.1 hypothetical protein SAMN05421796_101210 [Chryseobacterium piscicola]
MKIKLSLIALLILSLNSLLFAQGGWNIGYLNIGDVTKDHVGKIFRIDFKSNKLREKEPSIRSYFHTKDSNFLSIDSNTIEFIEVRKIYSDAGYYKDQFLVCKKCKAPLRILDMLLLEITEETLIFVADFETQINDQNEKISFKKEIEIHKNELEGLIFLNSKF